MANQPANPVLASNSPAKRDPGDLGAPQVIFDTVAGPNIRLRDNLIQLAAVIAGGFLGVGITFLITHNFPLSALAGGLAGVVGGLFISGIAIGIYRFITGVKRK